MKKRNQINIYKIISIILSIVVLIGAVYVFQKNGMRDRDRQRVSDLRNIAYALNLYQKKFGQYPTCITPAEHCVTNLQSSGFTDLNFLDPKTHILYSYAALGKDSQCTAYHLGASLENKKSAALLTGDDQQAGHICTGSAPDFSGLSYAPGGHQCDTSIGVPQPTDDKYGETCYDLYSESH